MGVGAVRLGSALPVRPVAEAGEGAGREARACAQPRTGDAGCRREPEDWNFCRFAMPGGQDRLFAGRDVRSLKGAMV
jgi:hypothetical protein